MKTRQAVPFEVVFGGCSCARSAVAVLDAGAAFGLMVEELVPLAPTKAGGNLGSLV